MRHRVACYVLVLRIIGVLQLNSQRSKQNIQPTTVTVKCWDRSRHIVSQRAVCRQPTTYLFCRRVGKAAVYTANAGRVPILCHGEANVFVWVKSRGVNFYSCYPDAESVDCQMESKIRNTTSGFIVADNVNTSEVDGLLPRTKLWGRYMFKTAARTDHHVLNVNDVSIFRLPDIEKQWWRYCKPTLKLLCNNASSLSAIFFKVNPIARHLNDTSRPLYV